MKRSLSISFLAFAFATAHAQTFPGNPDGNLLPAQANLPLTGGQIQNGATNAFTVQTLVGTANNGKNVSAAGRQNTTVSDVLCGLDLVGTTKFQFGGFTGKATGGDNSIGGMMIRGGFNFNGNFKLKPGHHLGWVQKYLETGGAGKNTIDSVTASPFYPIYTVPGIDVALVDIPFDTFAGNQITKIDFESALVCWEDSSPKELFGLGSFFWGYTYDNAAPTVPSTYAFAFTPGITNDFHTVFDREYGKAGTKGKDWTLSDDCDCFQAVPEPASMAAIAVGLAVLARKRRKVS